MKQRVAFDAFQFYSGAQKHEIKFLISLLAKELLSVHIL